MPVTELVFLSYKPDPQSLAELKAKENQIFQSFSGVPGLEKACRGIILEEDGVCVDAASMRNVLALGMLFFPFHQMYLNAWLNMAVIRVG